MTFARMLRPAFLALVAITIAGAAWAASKPRGRAERRNVLLITVGSLRADRIGCYTAGRRRTPAIDALAERGRRFGRAYAASVSTVPSVATILTGLYPAGHGIRDDLGGRLEDGVPTLAGILAQAGYRTGAVVGSSRLDSRRGLNRGFETFDDSIKAITPMMRLALAKERPAQEVVAKGLEFLDAGGRGKLFFLWLDFHDAHYEYTPPDPFAKEFEGDPYQGEIAYLDRQIGLLLEGLRARGLDRSTHILLAGSHGEGLGDHGETGHGVFLYESTIRVPLIIAPAGLRRGEADARLIEQPVGLVDLTATVLDLLGLEAPDRLDGVSLAAALERRASKVPDKGPARRLFVEAVQPWAAYGWSPLFAVLEGDRKIVHGRRTEAFDLRTDPGELRPVTPTPVWAAGLESFGLPLLGPVGMPEDEGRTISRGVASLALPWEKEPYCLDKQTWPDPRDRVDLNDKLFRARSAFDLGLVGKAAILSQEVLETDPANFTALDLVTFLAVRNGWNDMLMENLSILQCNYPFRGTAYHYWGHFLERRKDGAGAEKAFVMFSRVEPRNEEAFYDLAVFYAAEGKKGLALENLQRAVALGADDFETMRQDQRLHPLKDDPRFTELVGPVGSSPVPGRDSSRQ